MTQVYLEKIYHVHRVFEGLLLKYFIQKRNEDIINDVGYAEANTMFKAMLVHIKKEGEAGVNHKEPISTEDL
jgi:hypothetical protein